MILPKFTPLQIGERLAITEAAMNKARLCSGDLRKQLGLQLQFSHTSLMLECGYSLEESIDPFAPWDRHEFSTSGWKQDDKVATFLTQFGQVGDSLSPSHSFSEAERIHWDGELRAGRDVVIQSFVYVDNTHKMAEYLGPISWQYVRSYKHAGEKSWFFDRKLAYQFSLLVR